ncbi:MAG: glutamate-1-semialdehyde 2,1-aminomutase [Verrucomicrobiota bacterium]
MSNSQVLFEEALKVIPGGVNSPVRAFRAVGGQPFFVKRAKGARIISVDDRELIDYVCTWGPSILGHAPKPVIDAVQSAARDGVSFGTPNPFEVDLAKKICDWVPSLDKVRMCNSGTEATMSCVRLARGYTKRSKIIKFAGCYHGHVDALLVKAGSGALTLGHPDSAGITKGAAEDTIILPFNKIDLLEEAFTKWGEEIAAVILEPIPANAGLILPKDGFHQKLREWTDKYGSVLIFDEVMTGFRLAKGGAQELLGINPDLSAFGKVIGGGLPVGAFGGKAKIMDCLAPDGPVYQAGTLSGNPLAMAAGLAQLETLESENGYEKLELIGQKLEAGIRNLINQSPLNLALNRIGSMFCLFFTNCAIDNLNDVKAANLDQFKSFFHFMLDAGIYLPPSQFETCFLALAHGDDEIEQTLKALEVSLSKVK